jgi:hypothetical protein
MSDTTTGGSAFPKLTQDERWKTFKSTDGMTLRDYFASAALQGLLATDLNCAPEYVQSIADSAYVMADAMLKAREA